MNIKIFLSTLVRDSVSLLAAMTTSQKQKNNKKENLHT